MDLEKYDYDQSLSRINSYLASSSEWKVIYNSSSAQSFSKMFAWMESQMKFFVEELMRDLKFGTSKSLRAVTEHVKVIGYKPRRNISSKVSVNLKVQSPLSRDLILTKGLRFSLSDVVFSTDGQVTLPAGRTSVEVRAVQGYYSVFHFLGNGLADQVYDVLEESVENNGVKVYVNGVEWSLIEDWTQASPGQQVFNVWTIYKGIRIEFGDGIFGSVPPYGVDITVEVLVSSGSAGNINNVGVVGNVLDTVYQQDGSRVSLTAESITPALGGMDAQTVKDIKRTVPSWVTSGGVYKRDSELKAAFEDFDFVSQVNIYTEAMKPENERNMALANVIRVYVVPRSGFVLSPYYKNYMLNSLWSQDKLLSQCAFDIQEAFQFYLYHEIYVLVSKEVSTSFMKSEIYNRLQSFYSNFVFGDGFYDHSIHKAISEKLADNRIDFIRDNDIINIRNKTYIVLKRFQFEDWHTSDGFVSDVSYNELLEDGTFSDNVNDDVYLYQSSYGVLPKHPVLTFKVRVNGTDVVEITSGSGEVKFSNQYVQGSINRETGEYSITVNLSSNSECIFLFDISDLDIPLEPSEFPMLYDALIDVQEK